MQTANDPFDTPRALEMLTRLGGTISGFAERERQLVKAHNHRLYLVRRQSDRASEDLEADLSTRIGTVKAMHQQALEKAGRDHAHRKGRIAHAYHSSRKMIAERAAMAKDRVVGRTQADIMQTRHLRQEELARAERQHETFGKLLAKDKEELASLRREARAITRGYPIFHGTLSGKGLPEAPKPDAAYDELKLRDQAKTELAEARQMTATLKRQPVLAVFRLLPFSIILALLFIGHVIWMFKLGGDGPAFVRVRPALGISAAAVVLVYLSGWLLSFGAIRRLAVRFEAIRRLIDEALERSAVQAAAIKTRMRDEESQGRDGLSGARRFADGEVATRLKEGKAKLDRQLATLPAWADALHEKSVARLEANHQARVQAAREAEEGKTQGQSQAKLKAEAEATALHEAAMEKLAAEWRESVRPVLDELARMEDLANRAFPAWNQGLIDNWSPPAEAIAAAPVGRFEVDVEALAGGLPQDPRLALTGPSRFYLPVSLLFSGRGSLLVETDGDDQEAASSAFNQIALRLLAGFPPGRLAFTILDPVGLGKNFAGLMHLADYEETLIHSRIWTQSNQIEEKLGALNEHIEKVIQMYLRNEFATIAEYNEQAGTIAEKFHFLVVAGFPASFSDSAARRLLSIAMSGARCGVFLMVHRDLRLPPPEVAVDDELRKASLCVRATGGHFRLAGAPAGTGDLVFAAPPRDDWAVSLVHKVGRASIDSNRVEVPFSQIAPEETDFWSLDTTEELKVPIGRTGARKLQQLALGKGTRQHALIAGKTGSGKSTLFHVMITNLSLWHSPEQVEFYLVDFKKGVEFKCYATHHLPHARVVAIESDREFGLSVLQRVDAELRHRGELFRKLGVQDVAGYKRAGGQDPLPRTLLMIDEFQEFFTEDDPVAQNASLLLDRIVRQGRAFGIHVILGSQTLGGAYTLARATLGQMVVRVALQCNEADALLIMDDDNPAPRLLNRPGEGIYNDNAGALEANSPFQTVWLSEPDRNNRLDQITALARARGRKVVPPVVFEGNAPAEVRDNAALESWLSKKPTIRPTVARAWLGAPNSIKGPTEAVFRRQSGSHLLMVGQREETSLALLGISLVSLAAQFPVGAARFIVLEPGAEGTPARDFLGAILAALPHETKLAGPLELAEVMDDLAGALHAGEDPNSPEVFVVVRDLQRFKKLRQEDDYRFSLDSDEASSSNPAARFGEIILEGGGNGVHLLVSVDTYNNLARWVNRKALSEFEMRVLFQMSANDSANLIDSQAASNLGLHRALLYNEHEGTLETFRPYALPESDWIEEIGGQIAR